MKVKFVPQNVECEIRPGQSVLHVAQDNNIHIKSVCRGVPSCAECRVKIVEGEYNVIPPSAQELSLIGTAWFVDRRRLSCQLRCFGDITVDLTEQIERESAGKKPRGKYNKDEMQESRAVLGNLIMSDEEKKSGTLREDEDMRPSSARPSGASSGGVSRSRSKADGDDDDTEDFDVDSDTDGPDDAVDGVDGDGREGDNDDDVSARSQGGAGAGTPRKRRRRRGRRGKGRGGKGGGHGGSPSGGPST